jgi:hypothetical protein
MVEVGEVNNERGGARSPFHYLSSPCRPHRTLQQRLRIGVTLWRRQPEHRRIVPALGAEGGDTRAVGVTLATGGPESYGRGGFAPSGLRAMRVLRMMGPCADSGG